MQKENVLHFLAHYGLSTERPESLPNSVSFSDILNPKGTYSHINPVDVPLLRIQLWMHWTFTITQHFNMEYLTNTTEQSCEETYKGAWHYLNLHESQTRWVNLSISGF